MIMDNISHDIFSKFVSLFPLRLEKCLPENLSTQLVLRMWILIYPLTPMVQLGTKNVLKVYKIKREFAILFRIFRPPTWSMCN